MSSEDFVAATAVEMRTDLVGGTCKGLVGLIKLLSSFEQLVLCIC